MVSESPQRILVVMAHPDDAEFICGGSIAGWASEGHEIMYVVGTSGDKGSPDPAMTSDRLAEIREVEQREAARILGVRGVEFLGFRDAELLPDLSLRLAITRAIRRFRPDVLVCQDPTARWAGQWYIQHPDHIAMGESALAAVFPSARDRLTFPQLLAEGLEPHSTNRVLLAAPHAADHWIDVTAQMDRKFEALAAHTSQVNVDEVRTFLESWAMESAAEAQAHGYFQDMQVGFAESFKAFNLT